MVAIDEKSSQTNLKTKKKKKYMEDVLPHITENSKSEEACLGSLIVVKESGNENESSQRT